VAALAAVGLASGAVLFFFDPATHRFYPVCLFHSLTGLNCPGCGGTRAAHELLHGHLLRALRDNALLVLVVAGLLLRAGQWVISRLRRRPADWAVPAGVWWALLIITLLFAGLRNLPAFAWLSP
jgi:hypothetical protein